MRQNERSWECFRCFRDEIVQAVHRASTRLLLEERLVQEILVVAVDRLVRHCFVAVWRIATLHFSTATSGLHDLDTLLSKPGIDTIVMVDKCAVVDDELRLRALHKRDDHLINDNEHLVDSHLLVVESVFSHVLPAHDASARRVHESWCETAACVGGEAHVELRRKLPFLADA